MWFSVGKEIDLREDREKGRIIIFEKARKKHRLFHYALTKMINRLSFTPKVIAKITELENKIAEAEKKIEELQSKTSDILKAYL